MRLFTMCLLLTVASHVSSTSLTVTDIEVENFSNANHAQTNSTNTLFREYRSGLGASSQSTTDDIITLNSRLRWFQGMRVNPSGPRFALIYRHNIGYQITFTVNDPLGEGYEISVDQILKGYLTVSREALLGVTAISGLMLGRIDEHDGAGPVHLSGFSISGGGLTVQPDALDSLQTRAVEVQKTRLMPNQYIGTRTFTISFSSYPSFALVNIFQNYGVGEGVIQFGLGAANPAFIYALRTADNESIDTSDLGHTSKIHIKSLHLAAADSDDDGVPDPDDNCPATANADQSDIDSDGIGDVCDNCAMTPNSDQEDLDADGIGDVCDNCIDTPNFDQADVDGDGVGDACDNCVDTPNPYQEDSNDNGIGDACDFVEIMGGFVAGKINCKSAKGVVPTTLLGQPDFDAGSIDIFSLLLNGIPVVENHDRPHVSDIDKDGDDDVRLHLEKGGVCAALDTGNNLAAYELLGEFGTPAQRFKLSGSISVKH